MNNVSFQARVVNNKVPIKVVANNTVTNASIVELDITSSGNMKVINRVANRFQKALNGRENEYNYAGNARDRFNQLYNVPARRKNEHFYLLTTEKFNEGEDFDTMDADQVIGVAQVNNDAEKDKCELKYINIDPATNHWAEYRRYSDAGKSFLLGIENIVKKSIGGTVDDRARGFYAKLGYEAINRDDIIHRYENGKFTSPSE